MVGGGLVVGCVFFCLNEVVGMCCGFGLGWS